MGEPRSNMAQILIVDDEADVLVALRELLGATDGDELIPLV